MVDELQAREKKEVQSGAELTRPARVFAPAVDIFETDKEITVLADLPGVKSDQLKIDLAEDVLTLTGDVTTPEADNEEDVWREYGTGTYIRQFTISELINRDKIEAKLSDGVLRLTLPKMEKAQPRRISVQAG